MRYSTGCAVWLLCLSWPMALRTIPVAIAYAIWGAVGMVLIMLIGMVAFKQIPDLPAIIGILLIQAGILVINFFSKMEAH